MKWIFEISAKVVTAKCPLRKLKIFVQKIQKGDFQKPLWKMKSLEFLVKRKKFPEASDQMEKTLRPPE
jgi:hypothetical protein